MTTALVPAGGFVPGLVRRWVRLYCTAMPETARAARQLEIDSDLWEHYSDRLATGLSPALVSTEVLGRMLRGVPSDIAWRIQAEGFHVNIQFPVERIAGLFLLFLIVPFVAGTAISGYDTRHEYWPDEFRRFAGISSHERQLTGMLHGAIGLLTIAGVAILFATVRERSPKLITVACALLAAAGTIMLVNAALYRALSETADEFLATGNSGLASNARALALAIEGLAMMNVTATTSGVLCLAVALVRMAMVPRWTVVLPIAGLAAPVLWIGLGSAFPDSAWWTVAVAFVAVALWLIISGIWLLFGGSSRARPLESVPAHLT